MVTRSTRYGNPFRIREQDDHWEVLAPGESIRAETEEEALTHCLEWYSTWLRQKGEDFLMPLFGLDHIACWCPLEKRCHADVIIEQMEDIAKRWTGRG